MDRAPISLCICDDYRGGGRIIESRIARTRAPAFKEAGGSQAAVGVKERTCTVRGRTTRGCSRTSAQLLYDVCGYRIVTVCMYWDGADFIHLEGQDDSGVREIKKSK